MARSDFTEEIQVKVYRGHVRVPVVLLVPLAMLASLYCVLYFYVNSNWFLDEVPEVLDDQFPGTFRVQELVVEPTLTDFHVFGAQIRRRDSEEPIISAPEVHAEVSPVFLFFGDIVVSDGRAERADVRLVFDEQGRLNLLQALGIGHSGEAPDVEESGGGGGGDPPFDISLRSLSAEDCSFELVRPEFEFTVPDVDVPQASIAIDDGLEMRTPGLTVPRADFIFRSELFGFDPSFGDWEFTARDIRVEDWRWRGAGYRVRRVSGSAEGMQFVATGRMEFPDEYPERAEMSWGGRARVSVPYWSPLAQYFIQDTVHFSAPDVQVGARGSLEMVGGRVRAKADYLNTSGLEFTDVSGTVALRNQYLTLEHAEADFYGGRAVAEWGYFDMYEVTYGGSGHFERVNPSAVFAEYGANVPLISGELSGGFEVHGGVPMGRWSYFDDEYPTWTDGRRELAEMTITEPWSFRAGPRSSLPVSNWTVDAGTKLAVDYQRVRVTDAVLRAGSGRFDVSHLGFDYDRWRFESPGDQEGMALRWNIGDVRPWLEAFGVESVSGRATGTMTADGPVGAPQAELQGRLEEGKLELADGRTTPATGRLEMGVVDGALRVNTVSVESGIGTVDGSGSLEFARIRRTGEGREWVYRSARPVDGEWEVEDVDVAFLDGLFGRRLRAEGRLSASGTFGGTLDRPTGTVSMTVPEGRTQWVGFRDLKLEGRLEGDRIAMKTFSAEIGATGRLHASGTYKLGTGHYSFDVRVDELAMAETRYLEGIDAAYRPEGTLNLDVHGTGSTRSPSIAGDIEVLGLQIGGRHLGDVALVANTVNEQLFVSGAALPIGTLEVEVPLTGDEGYRARFGVENLDVTQVFPTFGERDWMRRLQGTGEVVVTASPTLSRYVIRLNMQSVRLETPSQTIRTDGPMLASFDSNYRLQIERARIGSHGRFVDVRGAVFLDSFLTSLQIEGALDLALVDLLGQHVFPGAMPDALVRSEGVVDVSVDVGGPPSRPIPRGTVSIEDATFELRNFSTPLRLDGGRIQFDRNAIEVSADDPVSGEMLEGVFEAHGTIDVEDYIPTGGDIELWTHNLRYRIPGTVNLTIDSDVSIDADELTKPDTWKVDGEIEIPDARYYRDISLIEDEVTGRVLGTITRRTKRYEAGVLEQYPWLGEMEMDVQLRARDGFVIDNEVDRFGLDLELRFNLDLQRTLRQPRVAGEVEVIDGTVQFQGETFDVQTGTVEYTGNPTNPLVEITAGADIRNQCVEQDSFRDVGPSFQFAGDFEERRGDVYHILLQVEGRLDALDVRFESNPYADQRDILSLMLTGCTVDELTASGAGQPTLQIALGPLLGRLEKKVRDVVEISEFSITPGVERTQVRIADRVSRRVEWRFQLDTGTAGRPGGQQGKVEYKLSDQWSLQFSERSIGRENNLLLDAKLQYRVPID